MNTPDNALIDAARGRSAERPAMTAQDSLLPCPFCGGHPTLTKHHREDIWNLIHRCEVVGAVSFDWGTAERHAARWNLRHPVARTPLSEKQVEDLIYAKHFRKGCDQLSYSSTQVNLNWYRLGLRDGERAHGITQEQG